MKKRNVIGSKIIDPSTIANLTFNEKAGAQKNTEVGSHLIPLKSDGTTFTTDASTIRSIGAGRNLAVYNNAGAVGSITFGEAGQASLAAGVTDSNGNVGIPCKPNDWTYLAGGERTHVIASAATLMVFLIEDDSTITGSN